MVKTWVALYISSVTRMLFDANRVFYLMISKYDANTRLDMCLLEYYTRTASFHSVGHTGQIWLKNVPGVERMCTM